MSAVNAWFNLHAEGIAGFYLGWIFGALLEMFRK